MSVPMPTDITPAQNNLISQMDVNSNCIRIFFYNWLEKKDPIAAPGG